MRRANIFVNVVAGLLVCSGIYGSLYSVLLIWNKEDVTEIADGFQTRTVQMADQIVQVAFVTQEERLPGAVTLMNSIISNTKNSVHFSIITDNSSVDHLWEWIENTKLKTISYQITALTSDWVSKNIFVLKDEKHILSYARLFFTKIFPSLKNRVIFLDDDIVVQGDISELYHTSIRPGKVGIFSSDCEDLTEAHKSKENRYGNLIFVHKAPLRPLQLNSSACTFSLGVSVIDVLQWEKYNVSQNAVHWIEVNRRTSLYRGEEPLSPLLISLDKKISILDPAWHVRLSGFNGGSQYSPQELKEAKLLQWNGVHKPWTKDVNENVDLWDAYYVPDPTHKFPDPHKGHMEGKMAKVM